MRELELNEIQSVSGGYPWWSIPIFAGGASFTANTWAGFQMGFPFQFGLARAFHFACPVTIASAALMATWELMMAVTSFIPSGFIPSGSGNSASCHG